MERLRTLIDNFRDQVDAGASHDRLMLTLQMLQSELMHARQPDAPAIKSSVHIDIPDVVPEPPVPALEKVVEVLSVDEKALEAELEQIRHNAEVRTRLAVQSHQPVVVREENEEPSEGVAVSDKKAEVHELLSEGVGASLNDRFVSDTTEVSRAIAEPVIKDLRKGIGVNDRFVFINELFRGDDSLYEKSIKTINSFKIYAEAEFWIRQELRSRLGWMQDNPLVRQFDQLIRRRFASI